MSTKKKWNIEDTCKLIELYRKSTILWDATNSNYKNKFKRANALKEIGIQLNTDANEIDRKLRNVYSQYSREKRAFKAMKKSNEGRNVRAKWFGYDLMSFLQDKNKTRKSQKTGLIKGIQISDSSSNDEENNDNIEICTPNKKSMEDEEYIFEKNEENGINSIQSAETDFKNNNSAELSKIAIPKNVSQKNRTPGSSKFKENKDKAREVFEMMKSTNENRKECTEKKIDDFDAFGDLVARKLRGFRTHYAQCTIQHLINNLLYDGELGKYDVPPQTFQAPINYNNYLDGSAASTSSVETVSKSSVNSKYYDKSSSTSTIPYSNLPSIQNVTITTPELRKIVGEIH